MNAFYLLTRATTTPGPSTSAAPSVPDAPLPEIRPGAFARWIAQVEAEAAAADAQAARGGFATNEGIAATRPEPLAEPG